MVMVTQVIVVLDELHVGMTYRAYFDSVTENDDLQLALSSQYFTASQGKRPTDKRQ